MKKPATRRAGHSPEFKGVVKKMTGRLTNRPDVEEEGRAEMLGRKRPSRRTAQSSTERSARKRLNPDPHRRG
jgi:hypothetical protein